MSVKHNVFNINTSDLTGLFLPGTSAKVVHMCAPS